MLDSDYPGQQCSIARALEVVGERWTLLVLRDAGGWALLRGASRAYLPLVLSPLREVVILAAWAVAPFKQHVEWRGKRYRLGAGTLLYAEEARVSRA